MKQFLIEPVRQISNQKMIKVSLFVVLFSVYGIPASFSQGAACSIKGENMHGQSLITSSGSSDFKATLHADGRVILNWSSAAGSNNSHFIMQKSTDGLEYMDAALLFATEDSQNTGIKYSYADNANIIKGKSIYYRIKMVSAAGKVTYTAPLQVSLEKTKGKAENAAFYPSI